MRVTGRAETSTVPLRLKEITRVRDLKALGGVADEEFDSGRVSDRVIRYPSPGVIDAVRAFTSLIGDRCALEAALGPRLRREIRTALHAFVRGHSKKVAEFEPFIDTLHFPMKAAVGGADNITITAEKPLVIDYPDGPTKLVYGTVTIKPGGYIEVRSDATIDAQTVDKEGGS